MHHTNLAARIQSIKEEMGILREGGGDRDWCKWSELKNQLENAYKEEELDWHKKSRVQWLKEGDKNKIFYHASVINRQESNRMENLDKERRGKCTNDEELVGKISDYYSSLFISEDSRG